MPSQKCSSHQFSKVVHSCQTLMPSTMMGPTTLVAVAIAHIVAVAVAVARQPPLSPLPSPCRPCPLHHLLPSLLPPSPLLPLSLLFLLPTTLVAVTIAIAHVLTIAVPIAIVTIACLPPLFPSPSMLHTTLVADAITLAALAISLFIAHHLCHHCHLPHHCCCCCNCHCCCCLPTTLIVIALAAVTIAFFVTHHPCCRCHCPLCHPPPLLPSPSP